MPLVKIEGNGTSRTNIIYEFTYGFNLDKIMFSVIIDENGNYVVKKKGSIGKEKEFGYGTANDKNVIMVEME